MITPAQSPHSIPQESPRPQAVNPDELGLIRFLKSVRNVFFPTWFALDDWRIDSGMCDVTWTFRCDPDARQLAFQDTVYANRDAFRAVLILGCIISSVPQASICTIESRLKSVRHMAAFIRREKLARYLDDLLAGLRYGDVSIEHGSSVWVFVALEWAMPASDARAPENVDALFEDSLLFTQIKRMLDEEDVA